MSIKVMIVDDSSVVRQVLQDLLAPCPDISVIGTASDPIFAMARMRANWPDVVVLDIEMPRMDGLTFLRQIMALRPTPVLICSSLAQQDAAVTSDALAAGAVEVIGKPALGIRDYLQDSAQTLIAAIRSAAATRVPPLAADKVSRFVLSGIRAQTMTGAVENNAMKRALNDAGDQRLTADVMQAPPDAFDALVPLTPRIIAVGASTGGPQALELVLSGLSQDCPGLVIVQHMPEKFTGSFARRLNSVSRITVREAEHHDLVLPGQALVAPGGSHLMVRREGVQYYVEIVAGPLVSRHRPSVDVLFRSVAKAAGKNAVGIIMTGMGDDGARGMKELRDCGALTYAQDEDSCVVFGMPREAVSLGGVGEVVALEHLSNVIDQYGS